MPQFFSVRELAIRYAVGESTIREWLRTGKITSIKLGKSYRVSIDDIMAFEAGAKSAYRFRDPEVIAEASQD